MTTDTSNATIARLVKHLRIIGELESADTLEQLAREREANRKDAEWRPIETAPKGQHPERPRYVLISNGCYVFVGYRYEPNYPDDPEWCDEHGEFIEPQPTHWMPLPSAPRTTDLPQQAAQSGEGT